MNFLELHQIAKSYGDIHVLEKLDLVIPQGETAAIVGQSGSGKSTLLSVIAGLIPPDAGKVSIENDSLWSKSPSEITSFRGKNIGIIFQDYHLIPSLTAEENVGLSLYIHNPQKQDPKIITHWLNKVGLGDRRKHYPHQLSGGEQQRVAIARALAGNPKILLADEPTGSLDESTASQVEELIFDLVAESGMTTLLITHNSQLANRCQKQYKLHLGSLHPQTPQA